jgi:oligopeptide transport system ATP-binding protein
MSEHNRSVELPINQQTRQMFDWDIKAQQAVPEDIQETILRVDDLKMHFPITKGLLKRHVGDVKAVDGVSFTVKKGQTLGLVGESGSGKSTIGNCIIKTHQATAGEIMFNGKSLIKLPRSHEMELRRELQVINQDPFSSLNPRMKVRDIILEGPRVQGIGGTDAEQNDLVERLLMMVGLNPKFADRYPHEFSGGQRQRISITRALALKPSFIVCDEIVSALDVSIQAQIVNLMGKIQEELEVSYLFIGHDLSVVRHISHQVAVMYLGKIMELADSEELYNRPLHPYTQALISAAPIPNPTADRSRERILLSGDIPSPINPPKGCHFCTRCRYADERCRTEEPRYVDVGNQHYVACHRVTG